MELFGATLPAPILLAPIGVQEIVRPEAETEVARAAASVGIPYILSTVSSHSMESVAGVSGASVRWFQLYWPKDPELAESLLRRAEGAGYSAVVVTLDTYILGWRPRDLQNGFLPFLEGKGLANYLSDPVFTRDLPTSPALRLEAGIRKWTTLFADSSLKWDDLAKLRQWTRLPILLKGILHPDDAAEAIRRGMDGIIVSNHGGRQVDGAIASLDALPAVVQTVAARIPVLFDSGIRTGSDALKALALGARAVLIGRPYIWALAVAGEQGVREYLLNFVADFDLALALSGHTKIAELSAASLQSAV
jgi:isopentenyl diphosphate isomerase/L-lactate dehydrogenase-like FMN-dependent dehydrogenase